jgi:hypothetical protein
MAQAGFSAKKTIISATMMYGVAGLMDKTVF